MHQNVLNDMLPSWNGFSVGLELNPWATVHLKWALGFFHQWSTQATESLFTSLNIVGVQKSCPKMCTFGMLDYFELKTIKSQKTQEGNLTFLLIA